MIMPRTSIRVDIVLVDRADHARRLHHGDAVGQIEDVVNVVADQEDADAFLLELLDEVAHLGGLGGTERGGRLVHDQDAGVEVDRAGDGHRLALAAGERHHRRLEALEERIEPAHHLAGGVLHGDVVERVEAA